MVQSVEARAKALKDDRKRLSRAERCAVSAELVESSRQTSLQATLLCECHALRKICFGPRDHLELWKASLLIGSTNALVSQCTLHVCFRVTPHDRTEVCQRGWHRLCWDASERRGHVRTWRGPNTHRRSIEGDDKIVTSTIA